MHWWGKTIFTHPQKTFLTQVFCKLLSRHEFMTFTKSMLRFYSKGGSGCWATQWMNSPTGAWKWDFKVLNESFSWTFNVGTVLKRSVLFFLFIVSFVLSHTTHSAHSGVSWCTWGVHSELRVGDNQQGWETIWGAFAEGGLTFSVGSLCVCTWNKRWKTCCFDDILGFFSATYQTYHKLPFSGIFLF